MRAFARQSNPMKRVVARESQIVGTYDDETLRALLNGGTLKMADQYWDAATSNWRPLTDFIGHSAPARRYGPALTRMMVLLAVAGCGSLVTWLAMQGGFKEPPSIVSSQANLVAPPYARVPTTSVQPQTTTIKKAAPNPAPAPKQAPAISLLSVEVFDDEVAVTVQNNSTDAVRGFDLKLKYFVLPGDQLVFDSNEKSLAEQEAARLAIVAKARDLDAIVGVLRRNEKLVSTDVIMWTPTHIKALPTGDQWKALGDEALGSTGAELSRTAAEFASGASGNDPAAREKALTGLLPELAQLTEKMKPLLAQAIQRTSAARNRLATELGLAEDGLAKLKKQQAELEPRLGELITEARKKTIRSEIVHVDAVIDPDLVQRITAKRQKNERHGVVVELASPSDKAVAAGW